MKAVRPKTLAETFDVDRSTLWRWVKAADFPKPCQLGPNTIAFDQDEADAWLKTRRGAREQAPA